MDQHISKFPTTLECHHWFGLVRDKKGFVTTLERIVYEQKSPPIEQFVDLWAGIWDKDEKNPAMLWMKKTKMEMQDREQVVNDCTIKKHNVAIEINKRKNWIVPRIEGIRNYWWKRFQEP